MQTPPAIRHTAQLNRECRIADSALFTLARGFARSMVTAPPNRLLSNGAAMYFWLTPKRLGSSLPAPS